MLYGSPSLADASSIFSAGSQNFAKTYNSSSFWITTVAAVRSVVCDKSIPATQYELLKSSRLRASPYIFSTTCDSSHARLEFCFKLQYFVMNSAFFDKEPSAMAISSSIKSTDTLTPRLGLLFLNSLMSFHFSMSSITYKKGNNFRSLLFPSRNLVDLLNISSYIESFIYPAVVHDSSMPSSLAPIPDFITSYCLRPASPSHDAISSHTQRLGLKPSDFLALNAIFLTVEFVAVM